MLLPIVKCLVIVASLSISAPLKALAGGVPPTSKAPPRYCEVPKASVELERALCDANTTALFDTISRMSESSDTLAQAIETLEKLWLLDSTLGDGLNWKLLGDEEIRARVVSRLALAIRNGQSTVPLQPLQAFAINYAHERLPDGVTYGIGLIGDTDAPGQFSLLNKTIKSPDRDARRVAIASLADMCSKNTLDLLQSLAGEKGGLDIEDRKRAAAHLERRAWKKSEFWCAHVLDPKPKQRDGEI